MRFWLFLHLCLVKPANMRCQEPNQARVVWMNLNGGRTSYKPCVMRKVCAHTPYPYHRTPIANEV